VSQVDCRHAPSDAPVTEADASAMPLPASGSRAWKAWSSPFVIAAFA
jgi:hypothetical protein